MNSRIQAITDAATMLFLRQGYARTQINHIAKAVGVSVGTIYHDFTGKKEIMQFVLKNTIDPDFINREFEKPITEKLFIDIEKDLVEVLQKNSRQFSAHLSSESGQYSIEQLISDTFDLMARYAVCCLFIEKNQYEFPYLSDHYKIYRSDFFKTMSQYLQKFIQEGTVRPLEQLELTATLIIENLTWWAMDRRFTSFETMEIPLEQAKQVCMDNIISAYVI